MVDLLAGLARANLAAAAGILLVLLLRLPVRRQFGAGIAYGLWALPALAAAAVFLPARIVPVVMPAYSVGIEAFAPSVLASPGPESAAAIDPAVWLVALWAAGALVALTVTAWSQRRFLLEAAKGAIGPAVVGVWRPRIIRPHDFARRFTADEQRLVLAHEEAHLGRQDARINGLVVLIQCLNWFNPLVHLAAHLMRLDQELACDEAVISRFSGARPAYAAALLKAQLATRPLPLGCYWPSRTRHPLFERIAMIDRETHSRARRLAGAGLIALLTAVAGLGAWAAQPPRPVMEKLAATDTAPLILADLAPAPEQLASQTTVIETPVVTPPATVNLTNARAWTRAGTAPVAAPPAGVNLTNAPEGAGIKPADIATAILRGDIRRVAELGGSPADLTKALIADPSYGGDKRLIPESAFIQNLDGRIALTAKTAGGQSILIAPRALDGVPPPATAPYAFTYLGEGRDALAQPREILRRGSGG